MIFIKAEDIVIKAISTQLTSWRKSYLYLKKKTRNYENDNQKNSEVKKNLNGWKFTYKTKRLGNRNEYHDQMKFLAIWVQGEFRKNVKCGDSLSVTKR